MNTAQQKFKPKPDDRAEMLFIRHEDMSGRGSALGVGVQLEHPEHGLLERYVVRIEPRETRAAIAAKLRKLADDTEKGTEAT